jgi:TPR repeat protein
VAAWLEGRIRAAERGKPRAFTELAQWLADSEFRDSALARRCTEIVFEGEDQEAADWVATLFLYSDDCGGWEDPRGNGADPRWAIRALRRLARNGNVHAMHSLYLACWRGAGVPRDVGTAERWARRAAKHGDCEPLNNLGVSFREGGGVRKDIRRAVRCYRTAAALGYPFVLRNLSKCYEHGEGVRADDRESVRLLRRAVALQPPTRGSRHRPPPCASAWADLGWRLVHGLGVRLDRARGLSLIRRAARAGWEGAREMLEELGVRSGPRPDRRAQNWK